MKDCRERQACVNSPKGGRIMFHCAHCGKWHNVLDGYYDPKQEKTFCFGCARELGLI